MIYLLLQKSWWRAIGLRSGKLRK